MTRFGFYGNRCKCFKVAQRYFSTNPQTKGTVQMEIVMEFHENAKTKTDLYTYLRLILNGNYVEWRMGCGWRVC